MANRRMFSKDVTLSDEFLELPYPAQALYFQIGMCADDYGYCGKVSVMRLTACKKSDLDVLIDTGFIYPADDKILFVIHWKENNQQRKERMKDSKHEELHKLLTNGVPIVTQVSPKSQHSIGEDSIGEDSIVIPFVDEIPKPDKKKELAHLSGKVITLFNKIKANGRDHDIENETHVKKFGIIIKALSKKGFKTDEQVLNEFERVFKHKKLQHDNQDHHWDHFRITTLSAKENFMAYRDEDEKEGIDLDEPSEWSKRVAEEEAKSQEESP